ncbi:MAG: carbonic anhydrase family protein [candidate division KSB1 bacterium]
MKQKVRLMAWCSPLLVALVFVACSQEKPYSPTAGESVLTDLAKQGTPNTVASEWGYSEHNGPEEWCDLDPAYSLCCEGVSQTPVNITSEALEFAYLPELDFDYESTELEVEHNGHTIEAVVPAGEGTLTIGGTVYELLQFHFHTQSEHNVNGNSLPIEMHLVHRSAEGALAVVGVFIVQGSKHKELDKIFRSLPQHEGEQFAVENFSLSRILPRNDETFRYSGSLTTPGCKEGVNWNVMAQPITMSRKQINAFQAIFSGEEFPHGNRRPVQPLNGRTLLTDIGQGNLRAVQQNLTAK